MKLIGVSWTSALPRNGAWAICSGDAVYFQTEPSRSAETARSVLGDYSGVAVCDGYSAYQTLAKDAPADQPLKLALCWSHARRKFAEAEADYPQCTRAIDLIGQLFVIDKDTPSPAGLDGDAKLAAEKERLVQRSLRAPPILQELKTWALAQRALPKSSLRKAIDYMLGHWTMLTAFLEDAYIPLDNNATERAIRGMVVGRKNFYGSRSVRGTQVAAIAYSLIESAKLAGLDAQAYITAAVYGIERGIPARELLPFAATWR